MCYPKSAGFEEGRNARRKALQEQVPTAPVDEPMKSFLSTQLGAAQRQIQAVRARLYRLLCDANSGQPTAKALDVTTGQTKDIIAAVVAILTTEYSMAMSVAIPVAVFLLKKGLASFCATKLAAGE
ncbi:hypothetical protein [Hymenobacter terrenus]|uniref:hypothetical protein n=1 Tax=Hymenobacter terrenus TaxID=1629124 RepID=UPI00061966B5|nr:hypothetical protein [Hymenobacter terrenus]